MYRSLVLLLILLLIQSCDGLDNKTSNSNANSSVKAIEICDSVLYSVRERWVWTDSSSCELASIPFDSLNNFPWQKLTSLPCGKVASLEVLPNHVIVILETGSIEKRNLAVEAYRFNRQDFHVVDTFRIENAVCSDVLNLADTMMILTQDIEYVESMFGDTIYERSDVTNLWVGNSSSFRWELSKAISIGAHWELSFINGTIFSLKSIAGQRSLVKFEGIENSEAYSVVASGVEQYFLDVQGKRLLYTMSNSVIVESIDTDLTDKQCVLRIPSDESVWSLYAYNSTLVVVTVKVNRALTYGLGGVERYLYVSKDNGTTWQLNERFNHYSLPPYLNVRDECLVFFKSGYDFNRILF